MYTYNEENSSMESDHDYMSPVEYMSVDSTTRLISDDDEEDEIQCLCPICGKSDFGLLQIKICIECSEEMDFYYRILRNCKVYKKEWKLKMINVHNQLIETALHPDRISWFIDNYQRERWLL